MNQFGGEATPATRKAESSTPLEEFEAFANKLGDRNKLVSEAIVEDAIREVKKAIKRRQDRLTEMQEQDFTVDGLKISEAGKAKALEIAKSSLEDDIVEIKRDLEHKLSR